MNQPYSDDILSAYFDAEASPEECQEARDRLASDDDARREFAEIEALSAMIVGQPRQKAPPEFTAAVMQAAERATLLTPAPATDSMDGPPFRSTWKRRTFAGMATAIAIVLTVGVFRLMQQRPAAPVDVATTSHPASRPRTTVAGTDRVSEFAESGSIAESEELVEESSPTASTAAEDTVAVMNAAPDRPTGFGGGGFEAGMSAGTETSPDRVGAVSRKKGPSSASATKLDMVRSRVATRKIVARDAADMAKQHPLVFDHGVLGQAEIGQIVEALDTSGERVAVVRLTVVDKRGGLESLQVLLARHNIPGEQEHAADNLVMSSDLDADRLMAVYVETDERSLSTALADLPKEKQFRDLTLEASVELASLDRELQNQFKRETLNSPADAFGDVARPLPSQPAPEKLAKAEEANPRSRAEDDVTDNKRSAVPGESVAETSATPKKPAAKPAVAGLRSQTLTKAKLATDFDSKASRPGSVRSLHRIVSVPSLILNQRGDGESAFGHTFARPDGERDAGEVKPATAPSAIAAEVAPPADESRDTKSRPVQVLFVLVADKAANGGEPAGSQPPKPADSAHDADDGAA